MISRKGRPRCSDDRLDRLIRQALRARVAGFSPPEGGWARLTILLARQGRQTATGREAGPAPLRRAVARCFELLDCVLPLLETPVAHGHDPRGARIAMHWRWLHLHRVTVHLLC